VQTSAIFRGTCPVFAHALTIFTFGRSTPSFTRRSLRTCAVCSMKCTIGRARFQGGPERFQARNACSLTSSRRVLWYSAPTGFAMTNAINARCRSTRLVTIVSAHNINCACASCVSREAVGSVVFTTSYFMRIRTNLRVHVEGCSCSTRNFDKGTIFRNALLVLLTITINSQAFANNTICSCRCR